MLFSVDPASLVPLHEQLSRQVRTAFRVGGVERGEQLPPARELGAALEINMHTVLRAYQQLRDEGLVDLRRGRGASIRLDATHDWERIHALTHELAALADRNGIPRAEIARSIVEL